MNYLPLNILERRNSDTIEEVAFAVGKHAGDVEFLLTGGPNPLAVLLSGQRAGRGLEVKRWRKQELLVVSNVEIEVSLEGMKRSAFVEEPIGAIVVGMEANGITALYENRHGVLEVVNSYFNRDPEDGSPQNSEELLFPKWRIVKRCGETVHELASFEAKTIGDR
ncbi:hypothetical protein [Qipengyuania aquimaris]|uniref:Uncharacterized protein n=1 Tax=Qipengyuania aquimaris TaxID=255984 RepID=A0A9Q3S331_9SPHN|nr:hypothetical protein [Qipengyuania aquimaris]MBY6219012.1 hypothetical protein [Qipengyuania aquimaris]